MALDPIILDELGRNHGVLDRPIKKPTGGEIPYVVRNPAGDWSGYLPDGEIQYSNKVDSMGCVSFSILNCIEIQEYFLTGKRVNYSDRWLAKVSGTTSAGNWLQLVADAIRDFGLVKEETWPTPANYTWGQYYADPTPKERAVLIAEGEQWLKTHKFEYGFIEVSLDEMLKFIKQCPLQCVIPGHAVANFATQQEVIEYFDTYSPFQKQTTRSKLSDAARPILTMNNNNMVLVENNGTYYVEGNLGYYGINQPGYLNALLKIVSPDQIEHRAAQGISQGVIETAQDIFQIKKS